MADRYAYIPLIGIFAIIAFGAADFAEARKLVVPSLVPVALGLIALAFMTYRQIGYWQSSIDLWVHTLAVTQNNYLAEDNLGGALILEGNEEEAFPHFQEAARIHPQDPMSHTNIGTYFMTHGRMQDAVSEFEAAIDLTSDASLLSQTYANLGSMQLSLGEDGKAQKSFDEALRLNPNQVTAWLGQGLLAQKQGKVEDTIRDLSRSVELYPTAVAYLQLGQAFEQANRRREALAAYEQALKISPEMTQARQAVNALREQR